MKKILLIGLSMLLFLQIVNAQRRESLQFDSISSWRQILKRAKDENKYILVDCFATWCFPCKTMDTNVYPDQNVASALNNKFVCVRVQMDTTGHDNEHFRSWRGEAQRIEKQYSVYAFPTFLYFNSEGQLVHRAVGFKDRDQFVAQANDAQDSSKAYYVLENKYMAHTLPVARLPYLASLAKDLDDRAIADKVAWDYINNYLLHLDTANLFTADNIGFIGDFLQYTHLTSSTPAFRLFYKNYKRLGRLFPSAPSYPEEVVEQVITIEDVNQAGIEAKAGNRTPNWQQLYDKLIKKYNRGFADRILLNYKLSWYNSIQKKNWAKLIRLNVQKIDHYGLDTVGWPNRYHINGMIWDVIFMHCNNKKILKKAAGWTCFMIKGMNADDFLRSAFTDTYANLLYKIGDREEALREEKAASLMEQENASKQKRKPDPAFAENLVKMLSHKPTW